MRVLINGLVATGRRTGIGHYTSELVSCLQMELGEEAIHLFQPELLGRAKSWLARLRGGTERTSSREEPRRRLDRWRDTLLGGLRQVGLSFQRRQFHRLSRRGRFDLYHEPSFLPLESDLPTILTVHDLSVLLHPEWHPADRVAQHQREFERGVARARHVLTISEQARQEILETLHLPPEKVTRTYMGVRAGLGRLPPARVQARLREKGWPSEYLLCLGTIEPRKNAGMLLRAYVSLPGSVRERFPLLLVGGWGWNSGEVQRYYHEEARHRGARHLGYVSEEDLPYLYNGARALVFPSHYEGFGLPPVEMLACGGAVLASTAKAVVETAGDAAELISPLDEEGWQRAMQRVCCEQEWWQQLRHQAERRGRSFTWERCAEETLQTYRRVLSGSAMSPHAA